MAAASPLASTALAARTIPVGLELYSVRKELAANRRVRIAYARQFDRGQRTLLDLVDIQNEIFNNETTLTTEKYTIIFGVYRTLATMGRLLDVMQIRLPNEARRKPRKGLFRSMKDEIPKIGFSRKATK